MLATALPARLSSFLVALLAMLATVGCGSGVARSTSLATIGALPAGPSGATQNARVVRVVDGDTVIVRIAGAEYRLRYIGINAPESVTPGAPVERMGHEAAAANLALVAGRDVTLEKDVSESDRFGRLLRYVWLHDGDDWLLVNRELVRRGFANAVTYPPDVKYQEDLREAEAEARAARVGLWARP